MKTKKRHDKLRCPSLLILPSGSTYTLCSIVNHIGPNPEEGHYNILLYNNLHNIYLLLDDVNSNLSYVLEESYAELQYLVTYSKTK